MFSFPGQDWHDCCICPTGTILTCSHAEAFWQQVRLALRASQGCISSVAAMWYWSNTHKFLTGIFWFVKHSYLYQAGQDISNETELFKSPSKMQPGSNAIKFHVASNRRSQRFCSIQKRGEVFTQKLLQKSTVKPKLVQQQFRYVRNIKF